MPHSPETPAPRSWFKTKVTGWFWSLTPTCHEVARLTSEARDHQLPAGIRMRLGLHRSFCQWCARYAKQLDLIGEASQLFPEHLDDLAGPGLGEDAKARLKRVLQERAIKESRRPAA